MKSAPTYSESWHVVAGTRVSLRAQVQVHRQTYRGEKWFLLRHPYTNAFYRLSPGAYAFVARLSPDRTVESVWRNAWRSIPSPLRARPKSSSCSRNSTPRT